MFLWILSLYFININSIFFESGGFSFFLGQSFGRIWLNINLRNLKLSHHSVMIIFGIWSLFLKTCFLYWHSILILNYFKVRKFIIWKLRSMISGLLALLARKLVIFEYFFSFLSVHYWGKVKLTQYFRFLIRRS
jgi:hypothetical protein